MKLPAAQDLLRHLVALRQVVSRSLIGWLVGVLICYPFWERLWALLLRPLHGVPKEQMPQIVASTPIAAVTTSFHVSMLGGALLAFPWIAWNAWSFLSPALHAHERRWARLGVAVLSLFFLVGVAFGYFVLLPLTLHWLVGFGRALFTPMWSLDAYASLCLRLLLAVGLLFEWPILTWSLARAGLVQAATWQKYWRYAVIGSFVLACFFVPPDPVSQSILAVPMVGLYLAGVLTARLGARKERT